MHHWRVNVLLSFLLVMSFSATAGTNLDPGGGGGGGDVAIWDLDAVFKEADNFPDNLQNIHVTCTGDNCPDKNTVHVVEMCGYNFKQTDGETYQSDGVQYNFKLKSDGGLTNIPGDVYCAPGRKKMELKPGAFQDPIATGYADYGARSMSAHSGDYLYARLNVDNSNFKLYNLFLSNDEWNNVNMAGAPSIAVQERDPNEWGGEHEQKSVPASEGTIFDPEELVPCGTDDRHSIGVFDVNGECFDPAVVDNTGYGNVGIGNNKPDYDGNHVLNFPLREDATLNWKHPGNKLGGINSFSPVHQDDWNPGDGSGSWSPDGQIIVAKASGGGDLKFHICREGNDEKSVNANGGEYRCDTKGDNSDNWRDSDINDWDVYTEPENQPPSISSISEDDQGSGVIEYTANANDPEGDSLSYSWEAVERDRTDGTRNVLDTYNGNPYTYNPGSTEADEIQLEVDDGNGGTASQTETYDPNRPASASFSIDNSGDIDTSETITLDGSASNDPDSGDSINEYRWEISGDGWSREKFGTTPSVTPPDYGEVDITLSVTSSDNTIDEASKTRFVYPASVDCGPIVEKIGSGSSPEYMAEWSRDKTESGCTTGISEKWSDWKQSPSTFECTYTNTENNIPVQKSDWEVTYEGAVDPNNRKNDFCSGLPINDAQSPGHDQKMKAAIFYDRRGKVDKGLPASGSCSTKSGWEKEICIENGNSETIYPVESPEPIVDSNGWVPGTQSVHEAEERYSGSDDPHAESTWSQKEFLNNPYPSNTENIDWSTVDVMDAWQVAEPGENTDKQIASGFPGGFAAKCKAGQQWQKSPDTGEWACSGSVDWEHEVFFPDITEKSNGKSTVGFYIMPYVFNRNTGNLPSETSYYEMTEGAVGFSASWIDRIEAKCWRGTKSDKSSIRFAPRNHGETWFSVKINNVARNPNFPVPIFHELDLQGKEYTCNWRFIDNNGNTVDGNTFGTGVEKLSTSEFKSRFRNRNNGAGYRARGIGSLDRQEFSGFIPSEKFEQYSTAFQNELSMFVEIDRTSNDRSFNPQIE